MGVEDFFKKVDIKRHAKRIEENVKEAEDRMLNELAVSYAENLSKTVKPYIVEFEKRGFRCTEKNHNLPYWCLEIRNSQSSVSASIVNGLQSKYELAFYNNENRIHCSLYIGQGFNQEKVEQGLQSLFEYLV